MVWTQVTLTVGSGYPPNTSNPGDFLDQPTTTTGSGDWTDLDLGSVRTSAGGVSTAVTELAVVCCGDVVTVDTGDKNATFEVAIKTSSPVHGVMNFEQQNNYIVMLDNVLSVSGIVKANVSGSIGGMTDIPVFLQSLPDGWCAGGVGAVETWHLT